MCLSIGHELLAMASSNFLPSLTSSFFKIYSPSMILVSRIPIWPVSSIKDSSNPGISSLKNRSYSLACRFPSISAKVRSTGSVPSITLPSLLTVVTLQTTSPFLGVKKKRPSCRESLNLPVSPAAFIRCRSSTNVTCFAFS